MIKVRDLSFAYEDGIKALDGVSFDVPKGKYVTIIGHNGSGKSTLARLLSGLLEKDSGYIEIDSLELNYENIDQIRRKIGIVFQNPDNQFIGSSVRDDIAFGLENILVPQNQMDEIIEDFAAKVNMSAFLDSEPSNLSGGQKQRVAIAGILAMNPDLIIFDEATSMLDPAGKAEIKALIADLHAKNQKTILSITHDIDEALLSDYVIVLNQGKVILSGEPLTVLKNHKLLDEIYLEEPYLLKVQRKLHQAGFKFDDVKTMDELMEVLWALK